MSCKELADVLVLLVITAAIDDAWLGGEQAFMVLSNVTSIIAEHLTPVIETLEDPNLDNRERIYKALAILRGGR